MSISKHKLKTTDDLGQATINAHQEDNLEGAKNSTKFICITNLKIPLSGQISVQFSGSRKLLSCSSNTTPRTLIRTNIAICNEQYHKRII
jgi:hypothetical protein